MDAAPDLAKKDLEGLYTKINSVVLPPELKVKTTDMVDRLQRMVSQGFYSEEFEKISHYVDWITALPWDKRVDRPIDLTTINLILLEGAEIKSGQFIS